MLETRALLSAAAMAPVIVDAAAMDEPVQPSQQDYASGLVSSALPDPSRVGIEPNPTPAPRATLSAEPADANRIADDSGSEWGLASSSLPTDEAVGFDTGPIGRPVQESTNSASHDLERTGFDYGPIGARSGGRTARGLGFETGPIGHSRPTWSASGLDSAFSDDTGWLFGMSSSAQTR